MWVQRSVETARGTFEIFEKGEGEPIAVTHLYSEYDERGNAGVTALGRIGAEDER